MVQPTKRISLSADLFQAKLNNVVDIDYGDAMKAEAAGIDLTKTGVIVERDTNGDIISLTAPLQNLAARKYLDWI